MRALAIAAALGTSLAPLRPALADGEAPTVAELGRARDLYRAGEREMAQGNFGLAAAHYTRALALSRDAVLLFKIASAQQRAGRCAEAVAAYQRYLREAAPSEAHAALTNERIAACGTAGEAGSPIAPVLTARPTAEPASPARPVRTVRRAPNDNLAWLVVGGGIGLLTIGGVLAYSADAAENDITDLYAGLAGQVPEFDEKTKRTYDELVAEGERYERLALISFGLAAVSAGVATYLFWRARQSDELEIVPTASPEGAGVSATLRW